MSNDCAVKRIGVVIAMQEELGLLGDVFGNKVESEEKYCGRPVLKFNKYGKDIVIVFCGCGEIGAAAAVQTLIDRFGAEFILNVGYVGSFNPEFGGGCFAVIENAVHYDYDISPLQPENKPGVYSELGVPFIPLDKCAIELLKEKGVRGATLASGDKFIADSAKKQALVDNYNADLCDMEGAAVSLTAKRNGVRCCLIKLVSDGADENSKDDFSAVISDEHQNKNAFDRGTENLRKAVDTVIENV